MRLTQEQRNSNIQIPMAINDDGRLDLDTMLTAVIDNTAKDLGVPSSAVEVTPEKVEEWNQVIVNTVINERIQTIENILTMFDIDGEADFTSDDKVRIPLKMKGTGRTLLLDFDLSGDTDIDDYIEAIEQSYREVLHVDG